MVKTKGRKVKKNGYCKSIVGLNRVDPDIVCYIIYMKYIKYDKLFTSKVLSFTHHTSFEGFFFSATASQRTLFTSFEADETLNGFKF